MRRKKSLNNNQRITLNIVFALAITAILISSYLLPINLNFPFLTYSSIATNNQLIPIDPYDNIAASVSRFLWDHKALDLINQAFVLLAAVLGCLSLLKTGDDKT
jgi:hypothetical protein